MLGCCLISVVEMEFEVGKARFLASLRNDSGGGIVALALTGTARFLASLGMTAGEVARPSPYREQRDFSLAIGMTARAGAWPWPYREQRDFSLRFEMTAGGGIMALALAGIISQFSKWNIISCYGRRQREKGICHSLTYLLTQCAWDTKSNTIAKRYRKK